MQPRGDSGRPAPVLGRLPALPAQSARPGLHFRRGARAELHLSLWPTYLTLLSLSFFTCKMEIMSKVPRIVVRIEITLVSVRGLAEREGAAVASVGPA